MLTSRNKLTARLLVGLSILALVFSAFAATSSAQSYGTDNPQLEYRGGSNFVSKSTDALGGFGKRVNTSAGETTSAGSADTGGSEIAFTGSSSNVLAAGGIAMVALGGAAVIASRRATKS